LKSSSRAVGYCYILLRRGGVVGSWHLTCGLIEYVIRPVVATNEAKGWLLPAWLV
jgi:hypothetical protein